MVQLRNRVAVGSGAAKEVIEIKGDIDVEWCHNAERLMLAGTHEGTAGTARVLPVRTLLGLFSRAQKILQKENTLVEVREAKIGGSQWARAAVAALAPCVDVPRSHARGKFQADCLPTCAVYASAFPHLPAPPPPPPPPTPPAGPV